nr:hypothetical protein [uncultured Undibacterium sp.]
MTELNQESSSELIYQAVASIASRFPFTRGKTLLNGLGIPTSLGWQRTLNTVKTLSDENFDEKVFDKLSHVFMEHTEVGEKLIKVYGYSGMPGADKISKQIAESYSDIEIPTTPFSEAYPFAVTDSKTLKSLEIVPPTLTAIFTKEHMVFFQFCSVRSFNLRVPLNKESFTHVEQEWLTDYSELYGVRPIRSQAFDTIVVNLNTNEVEMRLDAPIGLQRHQKDLALDRLKYAFNTLSDKAFGFQPLHGAPSNFYALLSKLYESKSEGSVFEIGFKATSIKTSSNNDAKLIRKNGQDLRKDDFHLGGKNAVSSIEPYTIGIEWKVARFDSLPKLVVVGTMKMLFASPVCFYELMIQDCYSEESFQFVLSRVNKYLT